MRVHVSTFGKFWFDVFYVLTVANNSAANPLTNQGAYFLFIMSESYQSLTVLLVGKCL